MFMYRYNDLFTSNLRLLLDKQSQTPFISDKLKSHSSAFIYVFRLVLCGPLIWFTCKKMQMEAAIDSCHRCIKNLRTHVIAWCAERPSTTLALVLCFTIILLPLIMAAVLMPFAILLDFSNFLATKGLLYIIYMIVFQVLSMAVLLLILFFIIFTLASSVTVLHSYNIFSK